MARNSDVRAPFSGEAMNGFANRQPNPTTLPADSAILVAMTPGCSEAATTSDPDRFRGAYLIDSKPAQPDPAALDDDLAERLWTASARLVGL